MRIVIALSMLLSSSAFATSTGPAIRKSGVKFEGAAARSLRKMGQMVEGGVSSLKLTRNKSNPNRVHLFADDGDSKVFSTFNVKRNIVTKAFKIGQTSDTE